MNWRNREASTVDRARRSAVIVAKIVAAVSLLASTAIRVAGEDDWIGPTATGPAAGTASGHLRGKSTTQASSTLTEVDLPADTIVPKMIFSDDGKTVWILRSDGILYALAVPSFERLGQLRIGSRCHSLARSAVGLLASLDGQEELWVIDPETLAVRRKIDVDRIWDVVASPTGTRAYCSTQVEGNPDGLAVVDLRAGRVVRQGRVQDLGGFPRGPGRAARLTRTSGGLPKRVDLTLDGKYLLTSNGNVLCRYACSGGGLSPDEAIECGAWALSPDGRYVLIEHKLLYKADVFAKPIREIPDIDRGGTSDSERFGFDKSGGKLYAMDGDSHLTVLSTEGNLERAIFLGNAFGYMRQIVVHPLGLRLLLRSSRHLVWIDLRQEGTRLEPVAPRADPAPAQKLPDGSVVQPLLDITRPPNDLGPWGWGAWSGDGDCLYWLDRASVLHKFQSPDWKETACVRIHPPAEYLAMSSAGLATYCREAQQLIVLDPQTLASRASIWLAYCRYLAGSPALDRLVVGEREDYHARWVDLPRAAAGTRILPEHVQLPPNPGRDLLSWAGPGAHGSLPLGHVDLTPDGSRLIAEGGMKVFILRGDRLVLRTFRSNGLSRGLESIRISHDGRWVMADRPLSKRLEVFSTDDIAKPAYTIDAPGPIWGTGIDGAGNVYMRNVQNERRAGLAVCGPDRQLAVDLKAPPYQVGELLGRPGHSGVASSGPKVWYFQPPGGQQTQPDKEPSQ